MVVPAFNAQGWLGATLESVLGQAPPPDEIIVVDDGSTDATAHVAEAYAGIRLLRQKNRGAAAARNAGAAAATGEAILFLDADDVLLPGAISNLGHFASRERGWGAVIPNHVPIGGPGAPLWPSQPERRVLERPKAWRLIRANHLAANALVRREAWRRLPFREELGGGEDLDFWLRLLLSGERIVMLGLPLVRWRARRPDHPAASRTLRQKREGRRRVFENLWARDDLTVRERLLVAYQLVRASAGEAAARVAAGESFPRSVFRRSPSGLVRAVGVALAAPGVLPALRRLDARRLRP